VGGCRADQILGIPEDVPRDIEAQRSPVFGRDVIELYLEMFFIEVTPIAGSIS
jgi:hypothetical protein